MAPPKRKTGGGRVTPKGTRPGGHPTKATKSESTEETANWSRSAAPQGSAFRESKPWAPYVAGVTLGAGVVLIIAHNLFLQNTWTIVAAMASLLVGLWALTKW